MAAPDKPVGDRNDAAAVPVSTTEVPVPTPEAAETGGPKLIRARHGDRFIYDSEAHGKDPSKGVVTGDYQQFAATEAKTVIEAAQRNGVRLAVADVQKKG